jgi:mRNA interferase YafQ
MNLKKAAADKRAKLPRESSFARSFLKDWERLSRAGRFDMHRLKEVMLLLIADGQPLGAEWLDHPLKGDWSSHRECHVGGDFLLVYKIDDSGKPAQIVFVRAGTHADLFDE